MSVIRPSSAVVAAQRMQMGVIARAGQENAILTAVRKQMEALEDKLSSQITRAGQQGDKLRDAGFTRFDNKLSTIEANQPRLDRRTAELAGNLRGLSDEMQCQIRRIDQTDSRLWEWRHQLEEELRTKLTQIETNYDQIASTVRVGKSTSEDMYKKYNQRILKLETMMEERVAAAEDTNQSIVQLHTRLTEVEDAECERARHTAVGLHGGELVLGSDAGRQLEVVTNPADRLTIAAIEAQLTDTVNKMEALQAENHELLTRVESQEERYKTLRTMQDAKDEQYRSLGDRLEKENWDLRLKEISSKFQDLEKNRVVHAEQLEIMEAKIHGTHQSHEELGNALRRLQERSSDALALMAAGDLDVGSPVSISPYAVGHGGMDHGAMDECMSRLKDSEERIDSVHREIQMLRSDSQVGSHVGALVSTLKDIAPKVISHDTALKELQDIAPKVGDHAALISQIHEEVAPKLERHASILKEVQEDYPLKMSAYEADIKKLQEDMGTGLDLSASQYTAAGKSMEAIEIRIGRLESEVSRLVEEVEGGEYGEAVGTIAEDGEDEQDAEEVAPNFRKQRRASSTE